jgi:hypothetical protein
MPLYARRDVVSVAVPPTSGGCGQSHSRPVEGGEPAKLWALDCPACSAALKAQNDPLWASEISKIPETPDEIAEREDREKRGQMDRDQRTENAFKIIAEAMESDRAFKDRLVGLLDRLGPSAPPLEKTLAQTVQDHVLSVDEARAELAQDPYRVRQADPGACPQCGGPLRKPGSRGPTPKVCADCRGKHA